MGLAPRIQRLKEQLFNADYEICLSRALHFTAAYKATEGLDPAQRCAEGLRRTLENQAICIFDDELIVGTKTEKFLSTPLSVDRGDFLRSLQMEMDVLHKKRRPFHISDSDRELFWREIVPYWDGRTMRDQKVRNWESAGVIPSSSDPLAVPKDLTDLARFAGYVGKESLSTIAGAGADNVRNLRGLRNTLALRRTLAHDHPTPAVYCLDVQGHLTIGLNRVLADGMSGLREQALARREQALSEAPGNLYDSQSRTHPATHRVAPRIAFLDAVIVCLEAAMAYSDRFADLAERLAAETTDPAEQRRLEDIAERCHRVPRGTPRTFHEALQSIWMTQVVAEIQFGTMDVFGIGRIDQFLLPYYLADIEAGRLDEDQARALLQEYFLKLSANVSPIPEIGMEANATLGNSQHCVTIGGRTPAGEDATNELSKLVLSAYEEMGGTVNQLCVRIHGDGPDDFLRRSAAVFRHTNGIALYNDDVIVPGLLADGFSEEDARDYTVVGCVETCGQANTQGCVAGHDFVMPAVLLLALTEGAYPPPLPGQARGRSFGDMSEVTTFGELKVLFKRQLEHQLELMVRALDGKDRAHAEMFPAPLVSALIDGCIESASDITTGGAKYDFTSIDMRGLATTIDSLLAIKWLVFERRELSLEDFQRILLQDFRGHEVLRQRIINEPPKYGCGSEEADALALEIIEHVHATVGHRRNYRGGRFRLAYFSLGNHVIDGLMLGATPDGRQRGAPISNGVSPSNQVLHPPGPHVAMRSAAKLPPEQVSSGVALNLRFHPNFIKTTRGLDTFTAMLRTYFDAGGMHVQPNFVSTETLREAQAHPERYHDLIVKVSGYSACFTDLGKTIQDDIIARAEFSGGGSSCG